VHEKLLNLLVLLLRFAPPWYWYSL